MSSEEENKQRSERGRFAPGNGVAKGPRKATIKTRQAQSSALADIFAIADGDPILIQQLMLKRGAELELDVQTTIKLCDKLAPYKEAKKASLDVKHDLASSYNVVFNNVKIPKIVEESEEIIEYDENSI